MEINNKNILIISGFVAPYGGNFISMLTNLAKILKERYNCRTIFMFPQQTEKEWLIKLNKDYIVKFTYNHYKKTSKEILKVIEDYDIDIVHTHFEAYDIPVSKAVKKCKKEVKMVWHLHDYQTLDKKGLSLAWLRKLKTHLSLYYHYGYYGKKAYFIGVSHEITQLITHYRNNIFIYPKQFSIEEANNNSYPFARVIINGIDQSRITRNNAQPFTHSKPRFLSFGGESYSKGIPTILNACKILHGRGIHFETVITRGYTTSKLLAEFYGQEELPLWLKIIEQTNDISSLFNECDAYISASHFETMSMAIAEASIFGLPIIQSDIPGTMWNSITPSSFLFKVGDSIDLANVMERIIKTDLAKLHKACQESSNINSDRLSMNKWCKEIIDVYKYI